MANDNKRYDSNQFKAEELVKRLTSTLIPINQNGATFTEKASVLCLKLEDLLTTTFKIPEIDHVAILPKFNRNDQLVEVLCRAYFAPKKDDPNGNITMKGCGNIGGGVQTILNFAPGALSGEGDFDLSPHFREVITPLSIGNDDNLRVGSLPNRSDVAVIDLDFDMVSALMLDVKLDGPYDFRIITAEPLSKDDCIFMYCKYINTSSIKKGRHRRKNSVDYNAIDREWARQEGYVSKNNRRSF